MPTPNPGKRSDALLLLNASEGILQLGVAMGGQISAWRELEAAGQGAEKLIPTLAEMLAKLGCGRERIGRIACVRGPGSFTGIRLALTTAFGLARAVKGPEGKGALLAGVDYLPLLADSALQRLSAEAPPYEKPGLLWTLTHARRGQVNMQGFSASGAAVTEAETLSLDEAVARMTNFQNKANGASALLGSGLTRNRDELAGALPEAILLPENYNHPTPEALLSLAEKALYGYAPVEPLYLRPCDAEENLPGIAAGLGLDPKEATLALARLQGRL